MARGSETLLSVIPFRQWVERGNLKRYSFSGSGRYEIEHVHCKPRNQRIESASAACDTSHIPRDEVTL